MVKLTKTVIDQLEDEGRDRFVWDDDIKGFGVRLSKGGARTFVFQYRIGGGRAGTARRIKIGRYGTLTPAQAREIARDWAADVAKGGDPAHERMARRAAPRMQAVFERYLQEYAKAHKKPKSILEDDRLIRLHLEPAFGRRKVSEITREHVLGLHNGLRQTPYQANRVLALFSKIMNLCELWGFRPDGTNPCRHIRKFREEKRERFLSPVEISRLGDVLAQAERLELTDEEGNRIWVNPAAITAIRLLILTGARCSEILGLKWSMIDWERGCALLEDSKTGKRALYLPAPALALLAGLPRAPSAIYIVPGGHAVGARRGDGTKPLTNIKDPWLTVRKHAGLDDVRLHDLRHSFASMGVANGFGLPIVGKLLGHRETATTARYSHLADDPLRAAADAIGGRVQDALRALAQNSA